MFKYWSIKKYGTKLLPKLEKRYGKQMYYTAHQVRATIYQESFNPVYLPLGYLLFLERDELKATFTNEFSDLNIHQYKKEILDYLNTKSYQGYLQKLLQ